MREIILKKRYPHSREEDITDAFMRGYEKGKADIPQGEWIRTERMGTFKLYDCSVCGIHIEAPWNFCPNCGARMKGVEDE